MNRSRQYTFQQSLCQSFKVEFKNQRQDLNPQQLLAKDTRSRAPQLRARAAPLIGVQMNQECQAHCSDDSLAS